MLSQESLASLSPHQSKHGQSLALKSIRARALREESKKITKDRHLAMEIPANMGKIQAQRNERQEKITSRSVTLPALYAQAVRELNKKKLSGMPKMRKVNRHPNFHPLAMTEPIIPKRPSTSVVPSSEFAMDQWRAEVYGSKQILKDGESLTALQRNKQQHDLWAKITQKEVEENKLKMMAAKEHLKELQAAQANSLQKQLELKRAMQHKEQKETEDYNKSVLADVEKFKEDQLKRAAEFQNKQHKYREAFRQDVEELKQRKQEEKLGKMQFEKAEAAMNLKAMLDEEQEKEDSKAKLKKTMMDMLAENRRNLQLKQNKKEEDMKRDIQLNEEMKERMERDERKRQEALEKIYMQQEMSRKRFEPLYNAMMQQREERAKIEKVQMEAYSQQREIKEKAEEDKKKKAFQEREMYLKEHKLEQEKKRKAELDENAKMAQLLLQQDRDAVARDKKIQQLRRLQNMRNKQELEVQMADKIKKHSQEMLNPMSTIEVALNKPFLDGIKSSIFPKI